MVRTWVRSERRAEEGSALVLVLALLLALSLALGAIFANAGANLTMSNVVSGQDNKVYAADGGVEYALQQLRGNSTLCGADGSLGSISMNSRTVDVKCSPRGVVAPTISPWALVTTDTLDPYSLSTQSGFAQTIEGPVYVSGGANLKPIASSQPLTVRKGDLVVRSTGACSLPISGLTVAAVSACTTSLPPDPNPPLPSTPPTLNLSGTPAYVYQAPGAPQPCTIWKPGTYKALPLGTDNYFASGVYYFEDTWINLNGKTAVGGQPGPSYPQSQMLPRTTKTGTPLPCSSVNDRTAGGADGFGVEFILGGSSTITVNDATGPAQLELFARTPEASSNDGPPGISIRTVPTPPPSGWKATTPGHPLVLKSTGLDPRLAVHGYVYVPEGSVSVDADSNVPLSGGLYCWNASLNSSGGVQIQAQASQPRYVVVTATAHGDSVQGNVTSTAVVKINNDPARTVDIRSWLTNH